MQGAAEFCILMLGCAVCLLACGLAKDSVAKTEEASLLIRSFDDLYEPSAVVSVGAGNFLIFEDDGEKMVSFHQVLRDGSGLRLEKHYAGSVGVDVNDIEGAAKGAKGSVFVMTSHSENKDEERNHKREHLLQLTISEKGELKPLGSVSLWDHLTDELIKIDPSFKSRMAELNVEGISFTEAGELLVGLRNPTYKGRAIIFLLENPYLIFSEHIPAKFSAKSLFLDLGGAGVRAMAYHERSGTYFLVSEVRTKKGKMRSRLWAWDGVEGHAPVRMNFPGLKKLKNIEGLTFFVYQEKEMVLFVCDDGSKKKKRGAHYALVEVRELHEEN